MRISIYIDGIKGGGAERFATLLSAGLVERNNDVRLLTGAKQEEEYDLSPAVKREILYCKRSYLKNACYLHKYNKYNSIDVCISIGIYANLVAVLSSANSSTKFVLSERNDPQHDKLSWRSKLLRKLLFWKGDGFVFQTQDAKSFYSKRIQAKGIVIPNPVSDCLPMRSNKHNKEIVSVGRLMPQKNYKLLLNSFALVVKRHPDYKLRIFGQGKMEAELVSLVRRLHIERNVFFEGFTKKVHELIKDSDIYILSSTYEGMPNSLIEAMAMGFPVISTDCPCGGPKSLIKNRENGLLVPVDNVTALSESISTFIENPELKEQCANKAKEIKNFLSLKNIIDKWVLFINETRK